MEVKYYERQNIRRRYGCGWQLYMRSFELQQGLCALCGEPSTKRHLKVDKFRRSQASFVRLVCHHCFYIISMWARDDKRARIKSYLEIDRWEEV